MSHVTDTVLDMSHVTDTVLDMSHILHRYCVGHVTCYTDTVLDMSHILHRYCVGHTIHKTKTTGQQLPQNLVGRKIFWSPEKDEIVFATMCISPCCFTVCFEHLHIRHKIKAKILQVKRDKC
jgi:hypothetical protein